MVSPFPSRNTGATGFCTQSKRRTIADRRSSVFFFISGARVGFIAATIWLTGASNALASQPEYLIAERSVPSTVEEEAAPMEGVTLEEVAPTGFLPGWKKAIEGAAPFWRDSRFYLRPRSYYLDRSRETTPDSEAAAYGGWLAFRSGKWRDRVSADAVLFTTQKAYGPDDKTGTLLLDENQEGFWVLGEANLGIDLTDSLSAKLYRQTFNIPYVNRNDSRMVPNTFEAYTLTKEPGEHWTFLASHIRQMKLRDSDDFVSMSEAAGFSDRDEPLTLAGAKYDFNDDVNIGVTWHRAWEFLETYYSEVNALHRFNDDLAIRFGAQYTDQQSVGDEIGGDFDTHVYGAKLATSYKNAILTVAFTSTDDARIRNPYGGYPGYLSLMIQSFNRAEEDGWLVGLSYDFERIGIPGLSGFVNYADGDTPDNGANASPDQWEFDITVDYRFQSRPLKGLWLRARAATLDQDDDAPGSNDVDDLRLILNYEWPFL